MQTLTRINMGIVNDYYHIATMVEKHEFGCELGSWHC